MAVHFNAETKPFWDGITEGQLRLQRCADCGVGVFYPRVICPECHSFNLNWFTASGNGTIYSSTVVRRAFGTSAESVPYTVALIDLDEGPRMLTRLVGDEPGRIGRRVQLEIALLDGAISEPLLPCFRVVEP